MKASVLFALLATAYGQDGGFKISDLFCTKTSDCVKALGEGACCQVMEVTAVPDDPQYGFIQKEIFKGQDMQVGTTTQLCFNKAMVEARAEASKEKGDTDNVTDLSAFLKANDGLDKVLELDENTVEALMDKWDTDEDTNLAFRMKYTCVVDPPTSGAQKLAVAGIAMIAAASQLL